MTWSVWAKPGYCLLACVFSLDLGRHLEVKNTTVENALLCVAWVPLPPWHRKKVPKLDKVISSEIYKVGTAMQLTPLWPIHQQTQGQSSDQHGNCRSTSHLIVWIKRDPWMDLWEVFQSCLRSKEHVSSLESQARGLTWPLSMSKK